MTHEARSATVAGLLELAEAMRANGTKILRVQTAYAPFFVYEVTCRGKLIGRSTSLAGAEHIAFYFGRVVSK